MTNDENSYCPMCRGIVEHGSVTDWCPHCDWQEVDDDELTGLDKTILKNEKNQYRIRQEQRKHNERVKRSYRIK